VHFLHFLHAFFCVSNNEFFCCVHLFLFVGEFFAFFVCIFFTFCSLVDLTNIDNIGDNQYSEAIISAINNNPQNTYRIAQ